MTAQQRQVLLIALLGGALLHPVFLVAAAAYHFAERPLPLALPTLRPALERYGPHLVWLIPLVITAARHPYPLDDALRHVVAYQFDYDYTRAYFGHYFDHTFSWWFGFEGLAGALSQLVGPRATLHLLQLMGFVLVVVPLWLALTDRLKDVSHGRWWAAFIVALLLEFLLLPRILQARPEVWFLGFLLLATILRPWAWLMIGLMMAPLYWLSIIYAPAVLLMKGNWRTRMTVGVIYALYCIAFWFAYSKGQWIEGFTMVGSWVNDRVADAGLSTLETLPVYAALANPGVIALLVLGLVTLKSATPAPHWKTWWPMVAVIAWFCLPNLVRYTPTIMTVYAILLVTLIVVHRKQFESFGRALPLAGALLVTSMVVIRPVGVPDEQVPLFDVPPNARVLTGFDTSAFSMLYANPDAIIAPVFEFGAVHRDIQDLIIATRRNHLTCSALKQSRIEYLVENTLTDIPGCLGLTASRGGWRLWQIQ